MSFIPAGARLIVRRLGLMLITPALVVCSSYDSSGTIDVKSPGTVSDLNVGATTDASATLSFTQVDDGTGQPAKYEVRYAAPPMTWGSATSVAAGSCAAPFAGTATSGGISCNVAGLSAATSYNFQVISFRGALNAGAVFGGVSNVASGSTTGGTPPPPPPVVTTVTVGPVSATVQVGATVTLQATVQDQNGNVMTGQTVSWSSDNAAASVSSSGVVTGVAAGSANITATSSGKSGTSAITVTATPPPPPVVTTVTVSPPSASVVAGSTVALQATVKDQNGNVMSGQTVAWSSNNASATVNSSGVVSGISAGSATITATSSGKSGTSAITVAAAPPVVTTVTVTPSSASVVAGSTVTLQATVKDQYGNVMSGQTVTWSSNSASATVNSSGVVSGVSAGSATISATSSGKSGTSAITVTAAPPVVTTVIVAPTSASVVAGSTVTLQATVKDQNGNVISGQTITWSSDNTPVATVNSSGVVTGVVAGSATITATSSGKSGTASITVTAPPPPPPPGGTLLFEEDFEDANISSRGWYDNTNVLISTAEHIAGSTASAQYHFLTGATVPTSSSQRHKFTPSNSFYLSYYVKYSTNWVGSGQAYQPHEFYTLSTLDGDYDGPSQNFLDVYVEHNYQNGGRPRIAIQDNKSVNYSYGALPNNLIAVTENRSVGGCNGMVESNIYSECFNFGSYWYNDKQLTGPVEFQPNPGPGYKNDWNFVEAYFQLNTIVNGIGQADGVVQYWFNGTLVIDRHDILFRTGAHPTLQFTQFLIAPYIGDGSPVDQSMWIDNLRVATGRIP